MTFGASKLSVPLDISLAVGIFVSVAAVACEPNHVVNLPCPATNCVVTARALVAEGVAGRTSPWYTTWQPVADDCYLVVAVHCGSLKTLSVLVSAVSR